MPLMPLWLIMFKFWLESDSESTVIVYGTYSPYLTGPALYWHTVCTFKIGPYQNTINYN